MSYLENLEVRPLFAEVDADVGAGDRQVGSRVVEAQVLDLVAVVQLDRLEVLQLAQIPQLDARVLRARRRQVVAVLGEGYGRNRTGVALEVGDVALLQFLLSMQKVNITIRYTTLLHGNFERTESSA